MRAMQLSRPDPAAAEPLRSVELADPRPGDGELLIEVLACAVCRTDLQIVRGDLAPRRLPIVPGHQVVGRVAAVGSGVSGWERGSLAAAYWLASSDGICEFCQGGRENLCRQARFTGWDVDGGYASAMIVAASHAVRLPADADPLRVAPLLCGGVIGFRALKRSGIQPGQRLGLYGFGASASLAIQVARHWGCEVYVASRGAADLERARALGAAWTGGYDDPPPAPLHAAITFAPVGSVVVQALRAVERGGTVAINAIHLDGIPAFDYDELWWERCLCSVANVTRADAEEFIALALEIGIETAPHPFPLTAANEALQALEAGQIGAGAAVLLPGE